MVGAFVVLVVLNFAYIWPILTDKVLPAPGLAQPNVVQVLDLDLPGSVPWPRFLLFLWRFTDDWPPTPPNRARPLTTTTGAFGSGSSLPRAAEAAEDADALVPDARRPPAR